MKFPKSMISSSRIDSDRWPDIDVIVVGGGISGLVTAYRILKKESTLKVLVLEKSERCGGQIYSSEYGEFGMRWITEDQHHVIRLCEELDITLDSRREVNVDLIRKWDLDKSMFSWIARFELNRFIGYLDVYSRNYYSIRKDCPTMEHFICSQLFFNASRNFIRLLVRAVCGVDSDSISFDEYLLVCHTTNGISSQINHLIGKGDRLVIKPNWSTLIQKLESTIGLECILCNMQVIQILQYENIVFVTTGCGSQFRTAMVVLSIPNQAIAEINFHPEIPHHKELFPERTKGMVTSFTAEYTEPGWKLNGFSGSCVSYCPKFICYENDNFQSISGLIFHNDHFNEMLQQNVVDKLTNEFGISKPLQWSHRTWEQSQILVASSPWYWDRIIWSSTNAGTHYRGYLNGAIQSGFRAAVYTLLQLRPQVIRWQDINDVQHASVIRSTFSVWERVLSPLNFYNVSFYSLMIPMAVILMNRLVNIIPKHETY